MGGTVERFLQQTGGTNRPAGSDTLIGRFLDGEEDKQRLLSTRIGNATPDSAARILRLEAKTGLPHDLIERNLDQIELEANRDDFDPAAFSRTSPIMAKWLAEHPKHLALASEDLTRLSYLERQFKNIKEQFGGGVSTVRLSVLGTKAMMGTITPAERKEQAQLEDRLAAAGVANEAYDLHGLNRVPGAVANQLPIQLPTFFAGAIGGAVAGGLSKSGTAGAVGWRIGAGVEAGRMEASLAYLDFEKLRDDRGEPLSRNTALGASIVVGVINGSLEMLGAEEMVKAIPGFRNLTKEGMKQALAKATTSAALRRYLTNIGEAAVTEGFTEFLQEMVTSTAGELAKANQDGTVATMSWSDLLNKIFSADHLASAFEAGQMGAMGGGGMNVVTGAASFGVDVAKARRAKAATQVMAELGSTVQSSKMMERLPDKMQEAVERLAKDGEVETLYAPIKQWREYWQSQKIDPGQAAVEVLGPEGEAIYREAEQTDSDLPIPTGRYATTLAATEHHNFFINELRSGPSELSAREAQERIQQLDKEETEAAAKEQDETTTAREASATKVADKVRGQLEQTGFDARTAGNYARVYQDFFTRMSEKTGETPEQLFDRFGLKIARVDDATVDQSALNQDISPDDLDKISIRDLEEDDSDRFITWHAAVKRHSDPHDMQMWEGGVKMKLNPETMMATITQADLPKDLQNKGWGTALYRALIDRAHGEGFRVFSDQIVSDDAQRIYDKLGRLGYEVMDRGFTQDLPGLIEVAPAKVFNQEEMVSQLRPLLEGFHSKAERTISEKMSNRATVKEVRALLKDVKEEERRWTGIDEFLDSMPEDAVVPKERVMDLLEGGRIEVKEVLRSLDPDEVTEGISEAATEMMRTAAREIAGVAEIMDILPANSNQGMFLFNLQRYSEGSVRSLIQSMYTEDKNSEALKGRMPDVDKSGKEVGVVAILARDEREARLKLRDRLHNEMTSDDDVVEEYMDLAHDEVGEPMLGFGYETYTLPGGENYREFLITLPGIEPPYKSPHFGLVENIAVHFRTKDRVDADGGKMLFIEELQSDWHQKGREAGYTPKNADPMRQIPFGEVPDAPFKKTWHELALKRIIQKAAAEGYDSIGWTTGDQQNDRYRLEKVVDKLVLEKMQSGRWVFWGQKGNDEIFHEDNVDYNRIVELVGKETADALLAAPVKEQERQTTQEINIAEVKVGGEGMRGFYDRILPQFLSKFVKRYGAKVGETSIALAYLQEIDNEDESEAFEAAFGHSPTRGPEVETPVHHMTLTPELRRAALNNEFTLYQSEWKHRSIRARFAGNISEIAGTLDAETKKQNIPFNQVMKNLALFEFMANYGLSPDMLQDIELIINRNPKPGEGKYRATIMLKQRLVEQGLIDEWMDRMMAAIERGEDPDKEPPPPIREETVPIGHIANDDIEQIESFMKDLQFSPVEMRQSRSDLIRNARNQMADLIEAVELDTIDPENKLYDLQNNFIKKHFGETVAEQANYGWGVDETEDGVLVIETKVYGYGVLVTTFEKGRGDVDHHFIGDNDKEYEDIMEVELFPELDRRDVDGLKVMEEIRTALNRGKSSDVAKLLMKLDMVNEVMRTSIKKYAKAVEEWARQPDRLEQTEDDGPKGRIRIGTKGIDIELLKKADLSTFIHESAHFFLEVMSELRDNAAVKADLDTIKHWLGKTDDKPFSRDEHELFARGFERYLLEGKAPVPRLQMAFARFKAWLVMIYQSVTDLNVELSDEVRGVFDRMLASQAEIEAARKEQNAQPLFADPKVVGMTETEAAQYNEAHQQAQQAAEEYMTSKIMKEFEREKSRVWEAERVKVRQEVGEEADEDATMRMWSLLARGRMPSGAELPEGVTPFKLDRVALEAQYPPEIVQRLSPRLMAKPGGKLQVAHPTLAADIFGFESAESMLESLAAQNDPKDWIEKTTNKRLRSRSYDGTPLKSMDIPTEARKAVHNEKRAQLLQKELQILARNNLPAMKGLIRKLTRRLPKLTEVRDEAQRLINSKRISQIKPDIYRRAEATAGKEAIDAFLKGDIEAAFAHKQRELLNHELYQAATTAKEKVKSGVKMMNKLGESKTQARLAKAGATYLAQIEKLLERFDFSPATRRELASKESLRQFLDEQQALGFTPDMPDHVLNEAYRKNYNELTLNEFNGIVESARLIRHLATVKNKLLASNRTRNLNEAVSNIVTRMAENHKIERPEPIDLAPGLTSRIKRGVKGLIAAHTKMEFMFEYMDGNANNGPAWTHLFQPLAQAEGDEHRMNMELIPKLKEIFGIYPKSERATWFWRKTTVKEVGLKMTKANMLAVALNWGNEGNRRALMDGYGWSEQQVEAILNHLDARDWATVQRIWTLIDSYWPQIEALEKELNGVAPEKVEPTAITNRHGTFQGGYYPIIFDAQLSWRQGMLDTKRQASEMFGGQWAKAMTRQGHTKERTNSAGKPVKLDLTPLTEHLTNVIHDLTHRRAVVDISRLTQREEIRSAIENGLGREMYKQIHPWLVNVAAGQRNEFYNPIESLLARGRMGATVVSMGYKMTTALTQVLSITNTAKELGPKYTALGLSDVWSKPWKLRESWDFVVSRSAFMDNRITSYDRDVRDALSNLNVAGVKPGPLSFVGAYTGNIRDSFFMFIGLMDMSVSLPTWMGAYRQAMDGAAEGIVKGDEDAAIGYADKIVRETQGVGAPKDMATVQRGPEAYKIFALFYSYFGVLFNQFAKTQHQLRLDKNYVKYAASLAMLWFVPAVLQDLMVGRGPDPDDDPEEWYKWLLKSEGRYPFQTIIILRDIINGMDRYGYEPSAALDMFSTIAQTLRASGKLMTDEEFTRAEAENAAMAAGYVTKLPSRQLWQTGEYLHDWMTGNVTPDNPLDAAWRALITGVPKNE